MRTVQSGVKCAKRAQPLEWQICEMDAEWLARQQDPLSATGLQPDQARRPPWVARHWRIGAVLLMVVAIIGDGIWRVAESGINQIETDLRASIEADLWWESMQKDSDPANHATTAQEGLSRPPSGAVHSLTLLDKTAIVQLVTEPTAEQPAFRQTRFYRQTPAGWLRTVPDAQMWGEPRQLESSHFRFHFRRQDTPLVAAVAPQIDAMYAELQHHLGLAPSLEKAVIEVSVAEPTGVMLFPRSARGRLVVPSPAVYLAPVELSEQEILVQRLPVLLASLAQYNRWETLVPAVFGVPATDFEAGWRSYLAQQYHVSLDR